MISSQCLVDPRDLLLEVHRVEAHEVAWHGLAGALVWIRRVGEEHLVRTPEFASHFTRQLYLIIFLFFIFGALEIGERQISIQIVVFFVLSEGLFVKLELQIDVLLVVDKWL